MTHHSQDPWVQANAGDLVKAENWNEVQQYAKADIKKSAAELQGKIEEVKSDLEGKLSEVDAATFGGMTADEWSEEFAPQIHDVQACLCLKGIVGVNPHFDEVIKHTADVATTVVDDGQAVLVTHVDHGFETGLVVPSPVVGGEEHILPVRDIAPDDHAVHQARVSRADVSRLDLGFQTLEGEFVGALDETPKPLGI